MMASSATKVGKLRAAIHSLQGVFDAEFVRQLLNPWTDGEHAVRDDATDGPTEIPREWCGYPRVSPPETLLGVMRKWSECRRFPIMFVNTEQLPFCEISGTAKEDEFRASTLVLLDDVHLAVENDDYKELLVNLGPCGISCMLGMRSTAGSVVGAVPPPREALLNAAAVRVSTKAGVRMNVAARALAKHCGRLAPGWKISYWGTEKEVMTGGDLKRNEGARVVINRILDEAVWMNMHHAPGGTMVLELRVREGYGARWNTNVANKGADAHSTSFRGFLEPHSNEKAAMKKETKK